MMQATAFQEWLDALKKSWENDFMPDFLAELRWTAIAVGSILLIGLVIFIVRVSRKAKKSAKADSKAPSGKGDGPHSGK